jgi:hypothetical protein
MKVPMVGQTSVLCYLVAGYDHDEWHSITGRKTDFPPRYSAETCSATHPASYSMGKVRSSLEGS